MIVIKQKHSHVIPQVCADSACVMVTLSGFIKRPENSPLAVIAYRVAGVLGWSRHPLVYHLPFIPTAFTALVTC